MKPPEDCPKGHGPRTWTPSGQPYCPMCEKERKAKQIGKPAKNCRTCHGPRTRNPSGQLYCPVCYKERKAKYLAKQIGKPANNCGTCHGPMKRAKSGTQYCPACRRKRARKWPGICNLDGTDFEDHNYNALLAKQDGKCAICGVHNDDLKKRLAADHDHETGFIRVLLCDACNRYIGGLGDTGASLQHAADVIKKAEARNAAAVRRRESGLVLL